MTDAASPEEHLDFSAPDTGSVQAPACASCGQAIQDEYWSVGTAVICSGCRTKLAAQQEGDGAIPARGKRLAKALLFGIGGMIAGAAVWYGVAKFLNLEVGLIAILLGWLVGKGVMKGSEERGGRRYQVIAVLLTYLGIGLGYLPLVLESEFEKSSTAAAVTTDSSVTEATAPAPEAPAVQSQADAADDSGDPSLLAGLGAVLVLMFSLPVLIIQGTFPGSLISILIYGYALLQAWRMTAARPLVMDGPFKVGNLGAA